MTVFSVITQNIDGSGATAATLHHSMPQCPYLTLAGLATTTAARGRDSTRSINKSSANVIKIM